MIAAALAIFVQISSRITKQNMYIGSHRGILDPQQMINESLVFVSQSLNRRRQGRLHNESKRHPSQTK